eukprot:symbB.v1.2.040151.t1/scaffold7031.1/size13707/2
MGCGALRGRRYAPLESETVPPLVSEHSSGQRSDSKNAQVNITSAVDEAARAKNHSSRCRVPRNLKHGNYCKDMQLLKPQFGLMDTVWLGLKSDSGSVHLPCEQAPMLANDAG